MNSFKKIGYSAVFVSSMCAAFLGGNAMADSGSLPPPPSGSYQDEGKVEFTRERLQDLKVKLNLTASQVSAWDAWSSNVIADVKAQSEEEGRLSREEWMGNKPEDLSTPERMANQEERLRNHIARMQAQLERIEAARKNTSAFYETLSKDQQTIFDLFWERGEPAYGHRPMGECGKEHWKKARHGKSNKDNGGK